MKFYLLACYAFFAVALWILFSCQVATEPDLEDGKKMSKIRLYSEWSFNVGPGNEIAKTILQNGWIAKDLAFGALLPEEVPAGATPPLVNPGISLNSNVLITGYQIKFKSPPDIRPSASKGLNAVFPVSFSGRKTEGGRPYANIPFVDAEYHEANILMVINQASPPTTFLPGFYAVPTVYLDTRNLQDVYKNTDMTMQIIIDVVAFWDT